MAHLKEAIEGLRNLVAVEGVLRKLAKQELHIATKVGLRIEVIEDVHNWVVMVEHHTVDLEVKYRSLVESYQPLILLFLKTKSLILFWEGVAQELHNIVEQEMAELAVHSPIVEYAHCL